MPDFTNSPNMNLMIPIVGVTTAPNFATYINSDLSLLDSHSHIPGQGVPITPAAIDINANLALNNYTLDTIKSLSFTTQTSISSIQNMYVVGVDLYYNDGNGNVIRITQGGSVSGASGTITGLPSGTASASYNAGTFVFQSATSTSANIDGGSYILRNNTSGSKGLTLNPPNAMPSDYSLTLPPQSAIPLSSTKLLNLDTSGDMSTVTYDFVGTSMTSTGADAIATNMTSSGANSVAERRTRASGGSTEGIGGVCLSGSSGSFTTASSTYVLVTNLSGTLATSGRPISVSLQPDGLSSGAAIAVSGNTSAATIGLFRGNTLIAEFNSFLPGAVSIPPSIVNFVETGISASTYTYSIKLKATPVGNTVSLLNTRLVVYEL